MLRTIQDSHATLSRSRCGEALRDHLSNGCGKEIDQHGRQQATPC